MRKLNVKGGTQRQAVCLARELMGRGHTVKLYTFLYSPADCYEDKLRGLDVVALGHYPANARFLFLQENKAAKRLAALIDGDTDLLNPHDQISYRVAYYAKKCMRHIPSVWMMNDMPTRRFSLMRDQEVNPDFKPHIIKNIIARLLDWWEIRFFIRAQDCIATLGDRDRAWVKIFFGKEAHTVRSGIDIDFFPYVEHLPWSDHKVRLLTIGIFFPHRRFEDIIEAIKILRDAGMDASLTIIGDFSPKSAYAQKILHLIEKRGLSDYVHVAGRVSEKDLHTAYNEHDMFVFSNHLESWGLSVFEAMASGLPVIVSQTSGASEVLTDGKNALLVSPKSPAALAAGVKQIYSSPDLYAKLSREGRTFVEQHISWRRYTDDMLTLFNKSLAKMSRA